jgi:hypothetical protein
MATQNDKEFYNIIGGLLEDVEKIEQKVENQKSAKLILLIIGIVAGIGLLITAVILDNIIVGLTGFTVLFLTTYFLTQKTFLLTLKK